MDPEISFVALFFSESQLCSLYADGVFFEFMAVTAAESDSVRVPSRAPPIKCQAFTRTPWPHTISGTPCSLIPTLNPPSDFPMTTNLNFLCLVIFLILFWLKKGYYKCMPCWDEHLLCKCAACFLLDP